MLILMSFLLYEAYKKGNNSIIILSFQDFFKKGINKVV